MDSERVVFLVRHGESEWNVSGRLQGQTRHVGLTARGYAQAAAAGRHLAEEGVDAVVSSDLVRASLTAAAVRGATGAPLTFDARLREQSYGAFDGCVAIGSDDIARAGGGESIHDVYQRVGALLTECAGHERRRVALVTHGETIRAAIAWLHGRTSAEAPATIPPNGSVIAVRVVRGRAARMTVTVPPGVDGALHGVVR